MAESEPRFKATALKYRPLKFADILAQPGVTTTLQNALARDRLHHAFLFCGPRGTGKTTTARVLAKALNCTDRQAGEPCGTCDRCCDFQTGKSLDIIEIDGASNRGVDDIRNLRERVAYAAAGGGYKVYIVDEVHMLTNEAFNALLKTLEEPPPKVAFIFATTEPGKVPATILSRCQRFDFRRIPPDALRSALQNVAQREGIDTDDEAIELIARRASGSLRDAFSLLDQTVAFADGKIDRRCAEEALGVVSEDSLFELSALWEKRDTAAAFAHLETLWEAGIDAAEWALAFGEHLRLLLAAKVGGVASPGGRYDEACASFALGDLLRAQVMLSDLKLKLRMLTEPRPEVELYVLRLFTLADTVSLRAVLEGGLESKPRSHPAAPAPAAAEKETEASPAVTPKLDLRVKPDDDPGPAAEPYDKFLAALRRKAPWAASELRRGRLEENDGRRAQFFVPDTNPFNQERFRSAGIQTAIVDAFYAVWGARPKVEIRFGEGTRTPADTQSLLEQNPGLAGLIAATDGEILARKPRGEKR